MKICKRITVIVLTVLMLIPTVGNISAFAYKVTESPFAIDPVTKEEYPGKYSYGNLTYDVIDGNAVIMRSTKASGNVVIPDTIDGHKVTEIADHAFYKCSGIERITIGNNVWRIGDHAFDSCINTEAVTIGSCVEEIGECAFRNCSFVNTLKLPKGIQRIGYGFIHGTDLFLTAEWTDNVLYIDNYLIEAKVNKISGAYKIKDGVTCIADAAFKNCGAITELIIPDSVTAIGVSAFSGCSALSKVSLGKSVKYIHDYAFEACNKLTEINIASTVLEIGYCAFAGVKCMDVDNGIYYLGNYIISADLDISGGITVRDGTVGIAERAFCDCKLVTAVKLPSSLVSISSVAFSGTDSLNMINIPASVTHIGGDAFKYGKKNLKVYIEDIGAWCSIQFDNCDSNPFRRKNSVMYDKDGNKITEITLPNGLDSIGTYCFYNCDFLRKISIPDSVKSIGNGCFKDCDGLTVIADEDSYAYTYAQQNGIISEPGCKHSFTDYISNNDLSCTTDETATAICSNGCGKTDTKTVKKASGHSYGEWTIDFEPTYTAAGQQSRICSVCHNSEILAIPHIDLRFTDVKESHWFAASVVYCVQRGYVSGMTDTTFVPNGNLTRAQFLTLLAKLDGADLSEYEGKDTGFKDVKPSHWWNIYVCWAVENGYTSGIGNGNFGPNNNVTRAQVARFFYVYSEKKGIDVEASADLSVFPDVSSLQDWAKLPMEWAVNAGIIGGVKCGGINYLQPNGTATRAQATVMFKAFDTYRNK